MPWATSELAHLVDVAWGKRTLSLLVRVHLHDDAQIEMRIAVVLFCCFCCCCCFSFKCHLSNLFDLRRIYSHVRAGRELVYVSARIWFELQ